MSKPRRVKRAVLQMRKLEEVAQESEESDSDDKPTQIEVRNVPEKITEYYLKTFFERPRSGGQANAVSSCRNIGDGVFIVSFHDPKGITLTIGSNTQCFTRRDKNCLFLMFC